MRRRRRRHCVIHCIYLLGKTWQQTNGGLIELDISSGSTCSLSTYDVPFAGIKKLLIVGYGATLTGNYFHLAGFGMYNDNMHSTRVASVTAGSNSVTVTPNSSSQPAACNTISGCTALFKVGSWALITGFDLMPGGFPANAQFFEYVQITGIDPNTGVITFSSPLKNT
jgi:hypothetical protein